MSVALRGNLEDFGIADVFQLVGQQRKTGVLEFSGRGERVQLFFDRGAVVTAAPAGAQPHAALAQMLVRCGRLTRERVAVLHKECETSAQSFPKLIVARGWLTAGELEEVEDLLTRETIFSILRWSGGSFDFRAQEVRHERPFEQLLGAEQILMDGLRMVDEWQSFAEQVPSEDLVFQRVAGFDEYSRRVGGNARGPVASAERVFELVDGRLAVRRIVDLSMLGTFDAVRCLAELRRAEVIAPVGRAAARKARRRAQPVRWGRAQARRVAASVFVLGLLGLVAFVSQRAPASPAGATSFAVPRDGLEGARRAWAALRVRHALESFRFARGHWPADLSELGARPGSETALARPQGRPYYYARREEGPVILAPER